MLKIVVSSLKGGTGKTSTTVNLAYALKRRGNVVGLLDVDCVAPTLANALGLTNLPKWDLDATADEGKGVVLPFEHDGLYSLTMASHYSEAPAVLWDEATLIDAIRQLSTDLIKWPALDYLLFDSPPSSSGFMQALFSYLPDLYGAILVFQPTDIASADLLRTLDFFEFKKVPILGLIANMAFCISPSGEKFWPFLSPEVDLNEICREFGIPFLGEIPLSPSRKIVDEAFDDIITKLDGAKPVTQKEDITKKLARVAKRKLLKAAARRSSHA